MSGVGAGALCRELEPSLTHLVNVSLLCELFTQYHLGIIFLNPSLGPLVMITAAAAHFSSTWHSHPSLLPHLCLVSLSWSLWPSSNKALNQVFQGTSNLAPSVRWIRTPDAGGTWTPLPSDTWGFCGVEKLLGCGQRSLENPWVALLTC